MREMKNSGVAWIGDVPENWETIPNKYLMRKVKAICQKYSNEDVLSLTMNGVIKRDLDNPSGKMPSTFDGYQFVYAGNLLMCLFDIDVTPRCIGLIENDGITSPAYSQFELKRNAFNRYYYYYYLYLDNKKELLHLAKNLRHSFTEEQFGQISTVVPPIDQQHLIANQLDFVCKKVEDLISNQEQQIEKLKQYKQSLITEVVTKGLNPDATMKDSGVKWIGMIPKHWIVKRTKFVANALEKGKGITKEEVISDGDIQCVRYGEIYTKYNQGFTDCVSRTNLEIIQPHQFFEHGDILFAGTGELVEEIGKNVVYLGNEKCLAGGDIIVMKHHQDPDFLNYALNSIYSQKQKSYGKAKLKVVHISADNIGNVKIALPPLDEQQRIATYLDDKCAKIDRLIAIKQEKINKLNDYKKSLIYEYVTGKKEA